MSNPFEVFENDVIKVVSKANDSISKEINAIVAKDTITINSDEVDVVEGDRIERYLPNGRVEKYEVVRSDFKAKFMTIPASYTLKVRKI